MTPSTPGSTPLPRRWSLCSVKYVLTSDIAYIVLSGVVVAACNRGFYKDRLVPGVCTRCPENTTTDHHAATSLADCKPLPGAVKRFVWR